MRIKRLATFLVAGGVFSLPLLGMGSASAASVPVVYIHEIQYSPAGPDVPVTTAKLDGEWVLLTNTTGKSVSMTNWTLRDKAGHGANSLIRLQKISWMKFWRAAGEKLSTFSQAKVNVS